MLCVCSEEPTYSLADHTHPTSPTDTTPPTIPIQSFDVLENVPIGTVVSAINATDNERIINYAITTGNTDNAFAISWNGLLTTANNIDHETTNNYSLTIEVTDGAGNTASNTVTVNVVDINLPPNVTISGANGVLVTEATLRGNLTDLGDGSDSSIPVSEHGFIYSTTASSESHLILGGIRVEKINLGNRNATGQFSNRLTGLEECRTYYYRAYAINELGTSFSQIRSFIPGRQHQTNNLNGVTDGEQNGLICPYGTLTYNIPLSNTHAYNLTVDAANNVLDNLTIYEDTTTNKLYIQAGPFSITNTGTTLGGGVSDITIDFSETDSGQRYLVLPLATTNHRLVISNNNNMEEDYTLTIGEETNTSSESIGRLLVDETLMGFFTSNDPVLYWVHIPTNMSLGVTLTAIGSGNACAISAGAGYHSLFIPNEIKNLKYSLGEI